MGITSRREREREERRQAILDAAGRVFERTGFDGTTMDQVASEAELSKGTLYLYFKSKDDLFVALSSRVVGKVLSAFRGLSDDAEASGIDLVRDLLFAYAEVIREFPDRFRVAVSWLASAGRVDTSTPSFQCHRQQIEQVLGCFVDALERGRRDGTVRGDLDPMQTAAQLWAGMLGVLLMRTNSEELVRRFPREIDIDGFVPSYVNLVCAGLSECGDK